MKRGIKAATKAEKKRFAAMVERGCVACLTYHDESLHPVEVHHINDCGRNIGHGVSVALCRWHHDGAPPYPMTSAKEATELLGPSLYHDGKAFYALYGNNDELLAFQESILRH